MGVYKEAFPAGTRVRILDVLELEEFARSWKFHHPLQPEQMGFAGNAAEVEKVGFYHGGDVIYELCGLPGYWHEQCLRACTKS